MLDGESQNPSCVLSIDINEPHYFMEALETHLFCCTHGGERIIFHDTIQDAFCFHCEKHMVSCFNVSKLMSFHCFPFKKFVDKLTSCYLLMAPTPWMMLSLSIPFESIWIHVLFYFARSLQQW